jgi:hypothetical protein
VHDKLSKVTCYLLLLVESPRTDLGQLGSIHGLWCQWKLGWGLTGSQFSVLNQWCCC